MSPPVEYGYCCAGTPLAPLRPGVRIKVMQRTCEPTKLYIVNPQMLGYRVRIHNSCTCNELVSLRNRHLIDRRLPEYDRNYMLSQFKAVSKSWAVAVERISYQQVVDCYKGAKRRMYNFARMEVVKHGMRDTDHIVRMFIKPDKYDDNIGEKSPRAIQYRNPRFNLVLASFLKPFEHEFYQIPSKNGFRVITKGLNPVEIASLFQEKMACFKNPVFLSCDHSKFDSSINLDHLKFEHAIYNRSYKHNLLRKTLAKQLVNVGFSRNGIRYKVKGTRMSGDYNTGLGNCLINRAVLESLLRKVKHEIMLDGDDSVVIVERGSLSKINLLHFRRCGFTTEVKVTDEPQQVEYCKRRLCLSNPPIMVRNPVRALSNLAVTTYNYGALGFKKWAMGALECERLSNPGVPVYSNLPRSSKIIKDADYQRKLENVAEPVSCSLEQLADTWQLSVESLRKLESGVSKYLGWDCDNRIKLVIQQLNKREKSHVTISAFAAQQAGISQRFCALCPTADECWNEIGAPVVGTTTFKSKKCPGRPSPPGA